MIGTFVQGQPWWEEPWLQAVAAAVLTAGLLYGGNGLEPVWWLMWLAPLPVLWLAPRARGWVAAVAAGAAYLGGSLSLWGYFHVLGFPAVAWLVIFGLAAVVFAVAVAWYRWLLSRGHAWAAVLAFPSLWVSFEYLRSVSWPHGTAASLAYTQLRFLPFVQLASLTGPWALSFVLFLVPAGVAAAFSWPVYRKRLRILAGTGAVLAAVFFFGTIHLQRSQPGPSVRVGLAMRDLPQAPAGEAAITRLSQYAVVVRALARQGAQVVVLPETMVAMTPATAAPSDAVLQRAADESGTVIVAGVNWEAQPDAYDQARIYAPDLPVRTYDKEHRLLPGEARFTPGTARLVLPERGSPWGVAICKDMDFQNPARAYGRAGAGLMLVPGSDFGVDGAWHGHIALLRGVEDGFSVARSAEHGLLTLSDARGRILAELPSRADRFVSLVVAAPAGHEATLYEAWGDWFAWVAMALAAWLGWAGWRRSRRARYLPPYAGSRAGQSAGAGKARAHA